MIRLPLKPNYLYELQKLIRWLIPSRSVFCSRQNHQQSHQAPYTCTFHPQITVNPLRYKSSSLTNLDLIFFIYSLNCSHKSLQTDDEKKKKTLANIKDFLPNRQSRSSTNWKAGGSNPGCSSLHANVSLGKILKHKLLFDEFENIYHSMFRDF